MPAQTSTLRELHRIHQQLRELNDRLARGPKQVQARQANVARLEAELQKLRGEAKAAQMSVDQKQLLLKSGEAKIKDLQVKINTCKSNREFQALKEQIAADEMANSVLADEILEALEKVDGYGPQVAAAAEAVDKARAEAAKLKHSVEEQASLIRGDIERLDGELRNVEAALPAELRVEYDRVVKSRGSDGMAAVDGNSCGGCYKQLTPNQYNSLTLDNIIFCNSCGRLLYLPEDRSVGQSD